MKTVLIIGDGWGTVPSHLHVFQNGKYREQIPNYLDFQFLKNDYFVINKAEGGGRNNHQLDAAELYLEAYRLLGKRIDCIVWFHTEVLRDWYRFNPLEVAEMKNLGLDRYTDTLADRVYSKAADLKSRFPHVKWFIIGGFGAIHTKSMNLLNWADLLIHNWRSEFTGINCPECQTYSFIDEFTKFKECFPYPIVERELKKKKLIDSATQNIEIFWNKSYPVPQMYKLLGDRIFQILEK